jgi:hypothetical protein
MSDTCRACGEPVDRDSDDTHFEHEEECPQDPRITCSCDVLYHAACCPTCNQQRKETT